MPSGTQGEKCVHAAHLISTKNIIAPLSSPAVKYKANNSLEPQSYLRAKSKYATNLISLSELFTIFGTFVFYLLFE
jgi:hypothetical protein